MTDRIGKHIRDFHPGQPLKFLRMRCEHHLCLRIAEKAFAVFSHARKGIQSVRIDEKSAPICGQHLCEDLLVRRIRSPAHADRRRGGAGQCPLNLVGGIAQTAIRVFREGEYGALEDIPSDQRRHRCSDRQPHHAASAVQRRFSARREGHSLRLARRIRHRGPHRRTREICQLCRAAVETGAAENRHIAVCALVGIVPSPAQDRGKIAPIRHAYRFSRDRNPDVAHRDLSAEILCRAEEIAVFQAAHDHRRVRTHAFPRRLPGQSVQTAWDVDRHDFRSAVVHGTDQLRRGGFRGPVKSGAEQSVHQLPISTEGFPLPCPHRDSRLSHTVEIELSRRAAPVLPPDHLARDPRLTETQGEHISVAAVVACTADDADPAPPRMRVVERMTRTLEQCDRGGAVLDRLPVGFAHHGRRYRVPHRYTTCLIFLFHRFAGLFRYRRHRERPGSPLRRGHVDPVEHIPLPFRDELAVPLQIHRNHRQSKRLVGRRSEGHAYPGGREIERVSVDLRRVHGHPVPRYRLVPR